MRVSGVIFILCSVVLFFTADAREKRAINPFLDSMGKRAVNPFFDSFGKRSGVFRFERSLQKRYFDSLAGQSLGKRSNGWDFMY